MEKTPQTATDVNNVYSLKKSATKAIRLLERLKSPHLHIASQSPKPQRPQSQLSSKEKQLAAQIEKLSRGCFSLARDQAPSDKEWSRYTRLKMVHHMCGHYSWVTIAQLEALGESDKCCCYCTEPMSLEHIGNDIASVQRFVEVRSGGAAFFSHRNRLEGADISDVFLFHCISPCKGMPFDSPFSWFLRDSKSGYSIETNGCPVCEARVRTGLS